MTRRLTRLAFNISLLAWLGLIAVPAVNAQGGGDNGVWIRVCLGTGSSWVQLSLDENDHRSSQNNHCPCTQNTLDTAWQPIISTRPPLLTSAIQLALVADPKPAPKLPYFSRAPPAFTADV